MSTKLSNIWLQLAAFVTLPFDVVKTHQQIELGEKEIYTGGNRFISLKAFQREAQSIQFSDSIQ